MNCLTRFCQQDTEFVSVGNQALRFILITSYETYFQLIVTAMFQLICKWITFLGKKKKFVCKITLNG